MEIRNKQSKPHVTIGDISNEYMVTIRNKFDNLQEISKDMNDENFVTTHMEAAYQLIQEPNVKFHGSHQ